MDTPHWEAGAKPLMDTATAAATVQYLPLCPPFSVPTTKRLHIQQALPRQLSLLPSSSPLLSPLIPYILLRDTPFQLIRLFSRSALRFALHPDRPFNPNPLRTSSSRTELSQDVVRELPRHRFCCRLALSSPSPPSLAAYCVSTDSCLREMQQETGGMVMMAMGEGERWGWSWRSMEGPN